MIGRWVADYPDADTFAQGVLHSREGVNGRYCGMPEIDVLAERARGEIDRAPASPSIARWRTSSRARPS